ncbi:MAG: sce7726 family protein [Lachnospiraceae bacterium]|nr:sce7726 family protein [Lachnospiraceae bacterium]
MSQKMQDYLLNKIFTVPYLDKMVCDCDVNLFVDSCHSLIASASETFGAAVHDIYQYMSMSYRNEYYFKNTIFNQLMIQNHDIRRTAAFTEFPIGESKADFVMINGKGVVYEIKTDLDNFDRLEGQLMDYYKVFPYVNVVVGYKNYSKAKEILKESPVGIYVLYQTNHLLCRKKAIYCDRYITHEDTFKVLRKREFEQILLKYKNSLPTVNNFLYYRECLKWIQEIDKKTLHEEMLACLKQRRLTQKKNEIIDTVPYELRAYAYFTKNCSCDLINQFCKRKVEGKNVLSVS